MGKRILKQGKMTTNKKILSFILAGLILMGVILPLSFAYISSWDIPAENPAFFVDCIDYSGKPCNSSHICISKFYFPNESLFLDNLFMSYFSDGVFNYTLNGSTTGLNITGIYKLKTTCNDTAGNFGTEDNFFTLTYYGPTLETPATSSGTRTIGLPAGSLLDENTIRQFSEGFWKFMKERILIYMPFILIGIVLLLFLARNLKRKKAQKTAKPERIKLPPLNEEFTDG